MGNTEVKRKYISKDTRQKVYKKFGGRCAYCGQPITYKQMQIDHVVSLYWYGGEEDIKNYFPACRQCNFYKSTMTLEKFRERLQTIKQRMEKELIYRLARNYGLIEEKDHPVEFYFEKEARKNESI